MTTIIYDENNEHDENVTALYWSCKTVQSDTALRLIQSGAPVNNPATRSIGEPASPLFWAATNGMDKVVEKLLEAGVDVTTIKLKDCANDETAGMISRKMTEKDIRGKNIYP